MYPWLLCFFVELTLKDPPTTPNYYSIIVYSKSTRAYTEQYPEGTSEEVYYEYIQPLYLSSEDASVAVADFDIEGG